MSAAAKTLEPRARDPHPDCPNARSRVRYIVHLMAEKRWVRGETSTDLAEDWGCSRSLVETYATEASRALELLGDREAVLELVRAHAVEWLEQGENDRVQTARLLVDTVGGFSQKLDVSVSAKPHDPTEVSAGCVAWLKEHDPKALLAAADEVRGLVLTEGEGE